MNYRRFVLYQGTIGMASSMIFPFYILVLKNTGNNYAQFGWAYGLFALTSALTYPVIGRLADQIGDKVLLLVYSWAMALLLLFFPLVEEVWQVYLLQIMMGVLGAVQKNSEKRCLLVMLIKERPGKKLDNIMSGLLLERQLQ